MTLEFVKPEDIEKRSMQIITSELNGRTWPEPQFSIVKRCIHTSADFDYADNLTFSEDAANIGVQAIRNGADIVTDTKMAAAGINKKKLAAFGALLHQRRRRRGRGQGARMHPCHRVHGARGRDRQGEARHLRHRERPHGSGQALRAHRPVGFVNVVESKEMVMERDVPFIVPKGRKGGSNIAATICNSMIYYKG